MQITLRAVGKALGITITKSMSQKLGLKKGDKVEITEQNGKLVIGQIKPSEYSLNELLTRYNSSPPMQTLDCA